MAPRFGVVEASQKKSVDSAAPQVVFTNAAPITINSSGAASPYPSNITVSGVTGTVSKVTVSLTNASHTWPDDVGVLLVGPTGLKVRLMTDCGGPNATVVPAGGPMSNVTLTFDDAAANFLPDGLNTPNVITTGTWKPTLGTDGTNDGGPHAANFLAPAPAAPYGLLLSAFNSVDPNGTWSLFVDDDSAGDSGSIAGGWSIDITTSGPPVVLQKPNVDMDGDGFSDYVVIREVDTLDSAVRSSNRQKFNSSRERLRHRIEELGKRTEGTERPNSPSATQMVWWTLTSVSGASSAASWGDYSIDTAISADFDGDETDDYIVWRPFTEFDSAAFYWINSSNNTFNVDPFGTETDDPSVVGDWDGDGIDDRATYRCPFPGEGAGPCYFFSRKSSDPGNTGFNPLQWGFGEVFDFVPCPADYDGDEVIDACIQRENPNVPGNGQFVLRRSSDGGVEYVDWGQPTDFVIPGDYDGDGKSDFCVRRNVGGTFIHFILERDGGGTGGSGIQWGFSTDVSVPGDYDGDGIQDIAVWRPSDGNFWVKRSTGGFSFVSWGLGSLNDSPVADWYIH